MGDEVIFEELPEKASNKRGRAAWFATLRARPGEWARVPIKYSSAGSYQARFGHEGFEFLPRTVDGERRVYGRYVGTT